MTVFFFGASVDEPPSSSAPTAPMSKSAAAPASAGTIQAGRAPAGRRTGSNVELGPSGSGVSVVSCPESGVGWLAKIGVEIGSVGAAGAGG